MKFATILLILMYITGYILYDYQVINKWIWYLASIFEVLIIFIYSWETQDCYYSSVLLLCQIIFILMYRKG